MHDVLAAGIESILWLQSFATPVLDQFFGVLTHFGGRYYIVLIPIVLWCVDYRLGLRILPVFAATLYLNTTIKEWIAQPRPFEMDERIISNGETGFGLPSGHAQLVVVYWGMVADWVNRRWFWGVAVAIMFLMGLSRVYLGVHFASDIVAGWALGAATLWAAIKYMPTATVWLARMELTRKIAYVLLVTLALVVFDIVAVHDHDNLNAASAGLLGGSCVGGLLGANTLAFDGQGVWWKRVLRLVLGLAGVYGLFAVMRTIGAPEGPAQRLFVAFDLFALGLWFSYGAPWLFERAHLGTERPSLG